MASNKRVSHIRVDQAPTRELRGRRGLTRLLINPDSVEIESLDLHLNELSPGTGPGPSHYHKDADNIYWVLDGVIEVKLGNEIIVLGRDELLHIPPGRVHATSNPGPTTARFIEIYSPAGEDFHIVEAPDV